MEPSSKIVMLVVPEPMSSMETPSSFSVSVNTESDDAHPEKITSYTFNPTCSTHFLMFCQYEFGAVIICVSTSNLPPLIPIGYLIPP